MPRGYYPLALTNYTPMLTSAPTPDISSATEAPLICVQMSAALVPYIIGALELYRWRDKWKGSDAQVKTAIGVMQDLIAILIEGDNCGEGDMPTSFRFTSDCGLEYTNDNGGNWIAVPGWTDFAAICFTGPQGEQGPSGSTGLPGADGAPGADGPPIELRTYFGTIQWRVVGTSVWNHLMNLSEISGADGADGAPGADGPPIELRTYFGTIQWRVVGTSVWNHLINLSDVCECDEPEPVNPNPLTDGLLCAIGFRVASEIRRIWDYAFTNPNNVISDLAGGVGSIGGLFALFWPGVGWGLAGGIAGFVGFMSTVFDSSETNSFTLPTENYLASLIYCELQSRQQREITSDLLNDVIPHLYDAPNLTAKQKVALMAFITVAPLEAWALAAYATAPYPDGAACASSVCPDEDDLFWCVQLLGTDPIDSLFMAKLPLILAMVSIERGLLVESVPVGYGATANYGYPFLPDIIEPYPQRELRLQVTFPRPTRIDGLKFEVLYNQTADTATGKLLKVVSDDGTVLINQTTTGMTSELTSELFEWWGDKEVKSLTITGQVWTTALWTDLAAQLRLTSFKIQGQGYNPFKPLTNCVWEYPPPPFAYDWCRLFDFTTGEHGFTGTVGIAGQPAAYQAGQGWNSVITTNNAAFTIREIIIERRFGTSLSNSFTVVGIQGFYSGGHRGTAGDDLILVGQRSNIQLFQTTQASYEGSGLIIAEAVGTPLLNRVRFICRASTGKDDDHGTMNFRAIRIFGVGTEPTWDECEVC